MSYTPKNVSVYTEAFAGAMAAISASNRDITPNQDAGDYLANAQVMGAFAESFDTVFDATLSMEIDELTLALIRETCEAVWVNRAPQLNAESLDASTYDELSEAIVAAITASIAYFASEGIVPPTGGGTGLPVAYQSAFAPGTQSTTGGPLTVLSLTTPMLPAGTYRISMTAAAGGPSAVAIVNLFNLTDAVNVPPTPIDGIDNTPALRGPMNAFGEVVFGPNDIKTFEVRLTKGGGGGGSVSIHDPRMEFWQVST
jgi:hypothetical protein